jgi:primosomal protein N' (replication factor Y)
MRVDVPFRKSKKRAVIIDISDKKPDFEVKDISSVLDDISLIDNEGFLLAQWISKYYLCTLGEALFTMLPREVKEKEDIIKAEKKELYALNDEQENAYRKVCSAIDNKEYSPFLLYGVTGSGKTEVYRHIAKHAASKGMCTLILVPEISLTPQTVRRFSCIFPGRLAVIHSRLNPREKLYHWKRIQREEVDVILGARSAVFAPAKNLGCIIIDEEHETSYKAGDNPKYSAKQVAFYLGDKKKIPVVLGSATPQIESYYHAKQGKLNLLTLKKRFSKEYNTDVEIVDMSQSGETFSPFLVSKIIDRLNKHEQAILFLNRRGFVPYVYCTKCGYVAKCDNCSITLTYHKNKNALMCHSCSGVYRMKDKCPDCSSEIETRGSGTEKIEELLSSTFPDARVGRMDVDTTKGKKGHEKILNMLGRGEIDILVGTQMIAKGLHFPSDIALNLPDFRASERTFSLLTQVSGRAGRGDIKGDVVIQTRHKDNFTIELASKADYESFYEKEIKIREENNWPPFKRIIRLILRGTDEKTVEESINFASFKIGTLKGVEILGPSPCTLSKVKKYYRHHMILRGDNMMKLLSVASAYKSFFINNKNVYLEVDTDALSML